MEPVFYLTYASRITWQAGMNKNIFADIYHTANQFNATQDITGFLCFGDGYFFQYLEGEESKVRALYDNICQDKRHTKVTLLSTGYLESKNFEQWDMAFINIHNSNISPKIVNFFGSWTPFKWQEKDANYLITLFKDIYQQLPIKDKKMDSDDLIYHYAGLYHLFHKYYKLLILQSVLILIAFLAWICIKFLPI